MPREFGIEIGYRQTHRLQCRPQIRPPFVRLPGATRKTVTRFWWHAVLIGYGGRLLSGDGFICGGDCVAYNPPLSRSAIYPEPDGFMEALRGN